MNDKDAIRQGYDELAETYASTRSVDEREVTIKVRELYNRTQRADSTSQFSPGVYV